MRTNLFIPSRFGLPIRIFTLAFSAIATSVKKYICAHLHFCPKLLRWNFLQISQLSIRSGAHKLFRRFLHFSQFLTAISRKLWRYLTTKSELYKSSPIWKKNMKPRWNRPINGNETPVWTMSPLTNSAPAWERDRQNIVTNITLSHLQPARVVRSPPNFACW